MAIVSRRGQLFLIAGLLLFVANFFVFRPSPEAKFISGFLALVVYFGVVAVLGGLLGRGLAFVFRKYFTNLKPAANILRLGLWIPVIGMWAVSNVYFVLPLGILAVSVAACYYDLISRSFLFYDSQRAKSLVTGETVLHALLVTLLIYVFELPEFVWFRFYDSDGLLKALSILIFILVTLCIVSRKRTYSYATTAEVHGKIVENLISSDSSPAKSTIISIAVIAVIWQTLALLALDMWISSPWNVLKTAIGDLSSDKFLWSYLAASMTEVCLGLSISVVITFHGGNFLSTWVNIESFTGKLLYLTHITPIVFVPWFFHWGILKGFWLATACVALFSFFPVVRVLSGLSSHSARLRVLLAYLEALPYAFVAMLFGETTNSFGGLGFALIGAVSQGDAETPMALFIIVCFLLVLMSWLLRFLARLVSLSADRGHPLHGSDQEAKAFP